MSGLGAKTVKWARRGVLAAMSVLGLLVIVAALRSGPWPGGNLVVGLAWLIPVLLPLRGVLAGSRRTHAWATLCVTPYLTAGVMETVANPTLRALGASIAFASVAWFAALICYLRVTRAEAGRGRPVPQVPA